MAFIVYFYSLRFLHLKIESHHFESTHNPPAYSVFLTHPNRKHTNFSLPLKKLTNNFTHCLTLSSMEEQSVIVKVLPLKIC